MSCPGCKRDMKELKQYECPCCHKLVKPCSWCGNYREVKQNMETGKYEVVKS